jgi:hypothetical protein
MLRKKLFLCVGHLENLQPHRICVYWLSRQILDFATQIED